MSDCFSEAHVSLLFRHSRHTKEICGIDLSGCKKWYKFIEVKYKRYAQIQPPEPLMTHTCFGCRPSGVEDRTVVFLPFQRNALHFPLFFPLTKCFFDPFSILWSTGTPPPAPGGKGAGTLALKRWVHSQPFF